jgi:shikimate 5-dehydrogenase
MNLFKIALLGQNINYSLSPKIFGHPAVQKIFPSTFNIINLGSDQAWNDFWNHDAKSFDYLCVTTPWKRKVYELPLKVIAQEVAISKTANWIIHKNAEFSAMNTDYFAFKMWWEQLRTKPKKIYYLGNGASTYSFFAMLKEQLTQNPSYHPELFIVTRKIDPQKHSGCFDLLGSKIMEYSEFYEQELNHECLLVNGSFYGQQSDFPIELTKCFEKALIWDLNYAKPYSYISFYQKKGLEFLINQALCFLISQKFISDQEFSQLQSTLTNVLSHEGAYA